MPDSGGKGQVCCLGQLLRQFLFLDGSPFFFWELAGVFVQLFQKLQITFGGSLALVTQTLPIQVKDTNGGLGACVVLRRQPIFRANTTVGIKHQKIVWVFGVGLD